MRRIFPLLLAVMLLCGCQNQSRQMQCVTEFRTQLLENGGCHFDAAVQAQYPQTVSEFVLACDYDAAADTTAFTVLEPELLDELSGTVGPERDAVQFADTALTLELLADGRLAPVALPQILAQSWASGYIVSAGADRDYTVAVFQNGYEDDTIKIETWFENGVPVYADVWYQGQCQAGVDLGSFNFQK